MIRIPVDCNWREDAWAIVIRPENIAIFGLKIGDRVVLHEPGMECEAILRRGTQWPWVADIVEGTIKDVPYDEQER